MLEITFRDLVDALSTLQQSNASIERDRVAKLILDKMENILKYDGMYKIEDKEER